MKACFYSNDEVNSGVFRTSSPMQLCATDRCTTISTVRYNEPANATAVSTQATVVRYTLRHVNLNEDAIMSETTRMREGGGSR